MNSQVLHLLDPVKKAAGWRSTLETHGKEPGTGEPTCLPDAQSGQWVCRWRAQYLNMSCCVLICFQTLYFKIAFFILWPEQFQVRIFQIAGLWMRSGVVWGCESFSFQTSMFLVSASILDTMFRIYVFKNKALNHLLTFCAAYCFSADNFSF